MAVKDFILASSSPQRKALLAAIYFEPKKCEPADIDETPHKDEKPTAYVKRMAQEKALAVVKNNPGEVILASDTIIAVGLKIFQKAKDAKDQEDKVRQMSGRAHRVITAVCLINKEGKESIRVNSNKVFVKKMSEEEIKEYIDSKEWVGVAGFRIEGMMQAYVKKIIGSYSGIVGLPLYETKCLLNGAGVK